MVKKRIIKDYNQLPKELLLEIKGHFPYGYKEHLLKFTNAQGETVSALPFETNDTSYLIKIENGTFYQIFDEEDQVEEFDELSEAEDLDLDDSEE